jgi:hypothetical protein
MPIPQKDQIHPTNMQRRNLHSTITHQSAIVAFANKKVVRNIGARNHPTINILRYQ